MEILQGLTLGRKCCPLREAEQNGAMELHHFSPERARLCPMKQDPTGDKSRVLGGGVSWDPSPGFLCGLYQGSPRVVMTHSRGPRARGGMKSRTFAYSSPSSGTESGWGQSGRHTHTAAQPRPAPP